MANITNTTDIETWFTENLPDYHPTITHNVEASTIKVSLNFPLEVTFNVCDLMEDIAAELKQAVGVLRDDMDALHDILNGM
jgi:hypothetical protein